MDALLYASTETLCSVSSSSSSYSEGHALYIVYTAAIIVGTILGFIHFMALLTTNIKRQTIVLVSLCITLIWGLNIILLNHGRKSCVNYMESIVHYLRLYSFDVWINWKQGSSCSSFITKGTTPSSGNGATEPRNNTTTNPHVHTGLDQDLLSRLTCSVLSSAYDLMYSSSSSSSSASNTFGGISSFQQHTFMNNLFINSLTRSEAVIITGMIVSTVFHTLSSYNFMPGSTILVWLSRHWFNLLTLTVLYFAIFFATSDDILVTLPGLLRSVIPSHAFVYSVTFEIWNILSTYILRADLAAILGLSSLISQILPEAGYIVAYNGIDKVITMIIFSCTLFYTVWRYQRIIQCMQARGLKAWTVLAEKSLVILCVQYWTDLPVHAPILFSIMVILDADLTQRISKATQRSAFQWLQYLILLFCRTRKSGKGMEATEYNKYAHRVFYETKGNLERTKDVAWICAPRFQRRFHRVGVTMITIMSVLGLFWSMKLVFSGFGGYGMDMHSNTVGSSSTYPLHHGSTHHHQTQSTDSSSSVGNTENSMYNSPVDTCIAVPHVGGAWGVYTSNGTSTTTTTSTNYHGIPYPNTIFRIIGGLHSTFSQGLSLLLFGPFSYDPSLMCSYPNRKLSADDSTSSVNGTYTSNTGCLMASHVMGISSLIMIPLVTLVGMGLSAIVYGLSFIDSLLGTTILSSDTTWQEGLSIPVYFHELLHFRRGPSKVVASYTGYPVPYTLLDGILETERIFSKSGSNNQHPNGGALQSWWIIQSILALAGMHLLLYGPPAEGLQRTLRKMFSENKYIQKGNRTLQREKEQAEAYMDDDNGDVGQELPLVIPAFITAPFLLSLAIWLVWTVIMGEPPLGVLSTESEPKSNSIPASVLLNAIPDILPSPLLGIIIFGFVLTCLLPRHRSNEVLRGTIALNHTIVGALLIIIAMFMMQVDMRPFSVVLSIPNAVNPYAWHLCTRMYFYTPSSLFISSSFALLVCFGTLWKTFTFSSQLRQATDNLKQEYDSTDYLYFYDEDTDTYVWTMTANGDNAFEDENDTQEESVSSTGIHARTDAEEQTTTDTSSTTITSGRKRAGSISSASRSSTVPVTALYYNLDGPQIGSDIDSLVDRLTTNHMTLSSTVSRYEADRRAEEDARQYLKMAKVSGNLGGGLSRGGGGGGGGSGGDFSAIVSRTNETTNSGGRSYLDVDQGSSPSSFPSPRYSIPQSNSKTSNYPFPQSSPVTSTSQYTLSHRPNTDTILTDSSATTSIPSSNVRTSSSYGLPQQFRPSLGNKDSNIGTAINASNKYYSNTATKPSTTTTDNRTSRSRSRSVHNNRNSLPVNYSSSIVPSNGSNQASLRNEMNGMNTTNSVSDELVEAIPTVGSKRRTMDDHDDRLERENIEQVLDDNGEGEQSNEYNEADGNEWGGDDFYDGSQPPSTAHNSTGRNSNTNSVPSNFVSFNRFPVVNSNSLGSVGIRSIHPSQSSSSSSMPMNTVSGTASYGSPYENHHPSQPPSSVSRNTTPQSSNHNNNNMAAVTSHDASIYFKRFKMVNTFTDPE